MTIGLLLVLAIAAAPGAEPAAPTSTAEIQKELYRLGYSPGKASGIPNESTRRAIRNFQRVLGEKPTGEPSEALLVEIRKPCEAYFDERGYKKVRGGCRRPSLAVEKFPDVYLIQVGRGEEVLKLEPLEQEGW
jgi:peptidoglycan hydrolase-like protein with peptidoglycan-binding domain